MDQPTRFVYDAGYEKQQISNAKKMEDYMINPPMPTVSSRIPYPEEALEEPEPTRMTQSNLDGKGMTVNRFEELPSDPQDWNKISAPFVQNTNSRLLTKDNHRPCLPMPMDQSSLNPPHEALVGNETVPTTFGCYPTLKTLVAPVTPSQAARLYRKTGASAHFYLDNQVPSVIPYPYVSEYNKDRNLGKLQ